MKPEPERDRLSLLLSVNDILNSPGSLDEALKLLLVEAIETFGAQRGYVLSFENQQVKPVAVHHQSTEEGSESYLYSKTIVHRVLEEGRSYLFLDSLNDERVYAPSITLQGIRSIMCVPLRWNQAVRGVVYLDNSIRAGVFKDNDLRTLEAIAGQASRSLETAALHEELERVKSVYLQQVAQNVDPVNSDLEILEAQASRGALNVLLGAAPEQKLEPTHCEALSRYPKLFLFGSFRVELQQSLEDKWSSRKERELLAFLACHRGEILSQEKLMDTFWPKGGKRAKHSLHNCITQIRKKLEDRERNILQQKHDGYTLGPQSWVDVEEFSHAFRLGSKEAQAGHWEQALVLLQRAEQIGQAEFMQGCFSDWIVEQRTLLQAQLNDCRHLLAQYFGERGTHVIAIELWKRVLQHDKCYEDAYRGLIQAYRSLGKQAEAVRTYQACVSAFQEELDLPPPEDLEQLVSF